MKWYSLPTTAIILTLSTVVSADEFGRFRTTSAIPGHVTNPFLASPAPSYDSHAVGAGVHADFPTYPNGFTSYRGVGYQGYCCEKNQKCAKNLWAGYCAGKGQCDSYVSAKGHCGVGKPCHGGLLNSGCGGSLGIFRRKPEWCCYPSGCASGCAGPGANWWPVAGSRQRTLGCKLRAMGDRCGTWVDNFMYGGTPVKAGGKVVPGPVDVPAPASGPAPTPAPPQATEPATPTSTYPAPQLPRAPRSIEMPDELPPLFPQDKSAWRRDFRRLPAVSVSY